MAKTAYLNTRIEPALKAKAERVLSAVGVSTSEAITMFFQQVVFRRGLPFEVCIPNADTIVALKEIETGGGEVINSSTEEAFDDILRGDNNRRA